MPLFMDIHLGEISVEDTKKAHLKDMAIQEKYGVRYLQYWFNEATGTVYYLMEGPDKESCAATHREATGHTMCQIMEVKGECMICLRTNIRFQIMALLGVQMANPIRDIATFLHLIF